MWRRCVTNVGAERKVPYSTRYAPVFILAPFLEFGLGPAVSLSCELAQAEQQAKKGITSDKADNAQKNQNQNIGDKCAWLRSTVSRLMMVCCKIV